MSLPPYAMQQSSFPEMYEQYLVEPLFRPWAEVLLDRMTLQQGERVLDVACGTGIVSRLARQRVGAGGAVVGVDLSPQMLAVARGVAPEVDWREGDASTLPVKDGEQFDVVVCHQGLQFFPDRSAALGEFRRVLVSGGRLGVACWQSLDRIPLFLELHRVATRHVGEIPDARFSLGTWAEMERLLTGAGFREVRVEEVTRVTRFAEAAALVRLNAMALVGMSAGAGALSDADRAAKVSAIIEDSATVVGPFLEGRGLAFQNRAVLGTAVR